MHIQFGGLEEQLFHHLPRVSLVDADENAQRERAVDVGLTDVENLSVVVGQNFHHRGREPRAVLTGDANEDLFFLLGDVVRHRDSFQSMFLLQRDHLYQREVDFHTIVAELETFWQSTVSRRMKSNLVRHVHEDGATNAQPTGKPNGIRHQLMRMMRLLEA